MSYRIFSWNVNGLRAVIRKNALKPFIDEFHPDILCLQETKAKPGQAEVDLPEYTEYWNSATRPGYSGTAIFTQPRPKSVSKSTGLGESETSFAGHPQRGSARLSAGTPVADRPLGRGRLAEPTGVPDAVQENSLAFAPTPAFADTYGDPLTEGRVLAAEYPEFYLVTVYTPNSKPDLSRLSLREKLWDPAFLKYLKDLEQTKPVVVCGDFNAAHTEIDLARPKANTKNAGFTPAERRGITNLLDADLIDTFRSLHPDEQRYTWWSHWARARENNVGWRIDYFFISSSLRPYLKSADIHDQVLGSDHCPISIELDFDTIQESHS